MTLQQIHYAITIAESGSLNKAAEILYIAQPSLTSSMQELERELGISIFNRSGRGVTLTADGIEFLQYAKQIYSQYEDLIKKYENPKTLKKKFGVSTQHYSFAVKAFVELVKSFDTLYDIVTPISYPFMRFTLASVWSTEKVEGAQRLRLFPCAARPRRRDCGILLSAPWTFYDCLPHDGSKECKATGSILNVDSWIRQAHARSFMSRKFMRITSGGYAAVRKYV